MSTTNRLLRSRQSDNRGSVKVTVGPQPQPENHEIQVVRSGDQIETIEVTCRCGEKIVIRCQYE